MDRITRVVQAHDKMRSDTQRLVSDQNAQAPRAASGQTGRRNHLARLGAFLAPLMLWGLRWLQLRFGSPLQSSNRVFFIFDPARTPRQASEAPAAFMDRVLRSNRASSVGHHLGISRTHRVSLLAVLPGITRPGTDLRGTDTLMDGILAWMGPSQLAALIWDAVHRSGPVSQRLKTAFVAKVQSYFSAHPGSHIILSTSNSYLVELIRMAALSAQNTTVTEVLHGIAATSMEPYYDTLSETALGPHHYVNLVADLPQFTSIEAHLLCDADGQIASNVSLNARLADPENKIALNQSLLSARPVLIIGGYSADKDYFETEFFAQERQIMAKLRETAPDRRVIYSPHPQIGRSHPTLKNELEQLGLATSALSTLELILHCPAVVGTFSSSAFEATMLERQVLLLPFDAAILPPALLASPYITRANSAEDAQEKLEQVLEKADQEQSPDHLQEFARLCMTRFGISLVHDSEHPS